MEKPTAARPLRKFEPQTSTLGPWRDHLELLEGELIQLWGQAMKEMSPDDAPVLVLEWRLHTKGEGEFVPVRSVTAPFRWAANGKALLYVLEHLYATFIPAIQEKLRLAEAAGLLGSEEDADAELSVLFISYEELARELPEARETVHAAARTLIEDRGTRPDVRECYRERLKQWERAEKELRSPPTR